MKIEAPELEGPKVVTKIDLDAVESSTRPKRGSKAKKEEAAAPAEEAKPKKTTKKSKEAEPVAEATPEAPPTPPAPPAIENIEVQRLSGPKIMGKIDLPTNNDTRPVRDEKKKRARIPLSKRETPGHQTFVNPDQPSTGFNRGRGGMAGRREREAFQRRDGQTIDEKEIQKKIQETQAKLSGGGGKGKMKAKLRREKRQEMAEARGAEVTDNKLQVTEFISVSELASLMNVSFAEVISKCMSLGIMV